MLKSELIEIINQQFPDLSAEDSAKSVGLILKLISESLCKNERIEIRGFGSFGIRDIEPKKNRNPKTGEIVYTQQHSKSYFKAGKELRSRVNKRPL